MAVRRELDLDRLLGQDEAPSGKPWADVLAELLSQITQTAFLREDHVALRIGREREARGWSQERLARELLKNGYSLPQSSISKIENPPHGTPRRSVSVDDAVALAEVFGLPLTELLSPPGRYEVRAVQDLVEGPHLAQDLSERTAAYCAAVNRVATELLSSDTNFGALVARELADLMDVLGVDSLRAAREALANVDLDEMDEPVRYAAMFIRDVLIAADQVKPRRRERGAYKRGLK